jgi:hypothetical protein
LGGRLPSVLRSIRLDLCCLDTLCSVALRVAVIAVINRVVQTQSDQRGSLAVAVEGRWVGCPPSSTSSASIFAVSTLYAVWRCVWLSLLAFIESCRARVTTLALLPYELAYPQHRAPLADPLRSHAHPGPERLWSHVHVGPVCTLSRYCPAATSVAMIQRSAQLWIRRRTLTAQLLSLVGTPRRRQRASGQPRPGPGAAQNTVPDAVESHRSHAHRIPLAAAGSCGGPRSSARGRSCSPASASHPPRAPRQESFPSGSGPRR